MITDITFNAKPIRLGEHRFIRVWSDTGPIHLAIECFRQPPAPPQLQACPECGSYKLLPGQEFFVTASPSVFLQHTGYLRVEISDASGDFHVFNLTVATTGERGGRPDVTA